MGAIKGVGAGAVATIVENRKQGKYKSVFDMTKRIDLRAANKKALENLILAGGFDSFLGTLRSQYFHDEGDGISFYEKAIRYGAKFQENENSSQVSLFGESSDVQIAEPSIPTCEDWSTMEKLAKEKEVVGIYISGHPLDDYKFEMKYFCNAKLEALRSLELYVGKNLSFGGIINNVQHRVAKNGKGWCIFTLEGYDESYEFKIFGEEYLKFRHFFIQNNFTFMKVLVKEGWVNQDTGKRSEPRIQFMLVQYLQDVLDDFAKKLVVLLNITDLDPDFIHKLGHLFFENKGDNLVTFEIMELEKVKKMVEAASISTEKETDDFTDENDNIEVIEAAENETTAAIIEVEEIKVVTKLTMASRKLKVKISNELLFELEKMQINFKLN
jgi:DNA polymerase-3 subunit alpha